VQGKGYYEEYRADEPYSKYGLTNPGNSDFVRQLWLDNDFYGTIFSFQYKDNRTEATLGGGYNRYTGNHFGDLIWASNGLPFPGHRWYDLDAFKTDVNIYLKEQTRFAEHWYYFYDLQYRRVKYDIDGFRDNPTLLVRNDYDFFNPKVGISYKKDRWKGYLSYSTANKEPNRDDFETGMMQQPRRERLNDLEFGIERTGRKANGSVTIYYMHYRDQLALTGKINDVGAYTRTNIPRSYRLGIELLGSIRPSSWMNVSANLAISRNKVIDLTEYLDDYDLGGQKLNHYNETDLAFSPGVVGGATINFLPCHGLELSLLSKYVGKEFLDNTQNESRKLKGFYTQDVRAIYTIRAKWLKELNITGQLNNVFNKKYEPNGYTYSYIYGGQTVTENYYFPMAGTNFMIGLNLKF
jgi:iron complex outermembrane receptor protein